MLLFRSYFDDSEFSRASNRHHAIVNQTQVRHITRATSPAPTAISKSYMSVHPGWIASHPVASQYPPKVGVHFLFGSTPLSLAHRLFGSGPVVSAHTFVSATNTSIAVRFNSVGIYTCSPAHTVCAVQDGYRESYSFNGATHLHLSHTSISVSHYF